MRRLSPNSGTPTSTTTSLSALSTTAIKDGHRGALHHRGHQHSPSSHSLEAERADRISRLAGLSTVCTLRGQPAGLAQLNADSPQTTPTSTGFPANSAAAFTAGGLTPAFFDAAGQPVAVTKVSTVGSASATDSVGGRTTVTTTTNATNATTTTNNTDICGDEDILAEMDSVSTSGYMGPDAVDEDLENLATQSVGGLEDRMSDDGTASLVGFGEGASSTVSGPIYHRRPVPGQGTAAAAMWALEGAGARAASPSPHHHHHHHPQLGGGSAAAAANNRRDTASRASERDTGGSDTPVSQSAMRERRAARMVDGVAVDPSTAAAASDGPASAAVSASAHPMTMAAAGGGNNNDNDDVFIDTTTRGPVPVQPTRTSGPRETQEQQKSPSSSS